MRHDERGVALPLALFALIVIGALAAVSFHAARLEWQSGRNTLFVAQAREAAEAGLDEALGVLDPVVLEAMSAGGAPVALVELQSDVGTVLRDVRRLTGALFLVRSHARRQSADGGVLATRSLGAIVRLVPAADGGLAAKIVERGWFSLY